MKKSLLISVLSWLLTPIVALNAPAPAHYRTGPHGVKLNDITATPGEVRTIDKNDRAICGEIKPGESRTDQYRGAVTPKLKGQVCLEYGLAPHCYGRTSNEIDHLISLELGGADEIANLWPQPYDEHPGAHEKDTLENWLRREVCSGRMELQEAQRAMATDWYAAYLVMLKSRHPAADGEAEEEDASNAKDCTGQCGHNDRNCQDRCLDRNYCPSEDSSL